ncbi:hypothetical protein HAX54_003468 [Datura stramonium]|uniref:Uncharacterized protein n=1 Tax=Datura stramonium TaxID=4076 RepID=A0ABS8T6Y7_DATST|nr:hypothetical protein [Datura stramonium]
MEKVKDPELLIKYCEPLPDDEEELQNCPFEYEYEDTPQSSPSVAVTVSQPTGILMLSVSSTDSDEQSSARENEEFETPPEQNNSSQPYFSGSDEQKPSTSAGVDFQHNNGDTDSVNHDNMVAVDLGNDSNDLGFSDRRDIDLPYIAEFEEQLRKRYRVSREDLDVKTSAPTIVKKEPIVVEIDQTQEVDTEVIECEENFKVCECRVERNADSSTVKMSERGCEEGDGGELPENGERGSDDNEKLNDNGERGADDNEKLNGVGTGEMHLNGIKDDDGDKGVVSMNLDENEKLNGVCVKEMHSNGGTASVDVDVVVCVNGGGAGRVEGRRELPLSIRGGDKNVGPLEEVGRRATKNGKFKDLVEAFSMVVGDVSGDDNNAADFLETARRRGLSFPQPRWWPPEGFAD